MSLERYSLKYKLKKIGGYRAICGRSGKDFYLSLIAALFYLAIIRYDNAILNWWSIYKPNMPFVASPIAVLVALIIGILKLRNDVICDSAFNKKLDNNDFLATVECFYDFPVRITYAAIIIWVMFVILWFINSEINDTIVINEFVAYAFALPFFFILYCISNFFYCITATEFYRGLEIKYSKKK
jgi:hypothetical protein